MHVLPSGFHRIRYYGFLTCQTRAKNIERIRELLALPLIPLDDIKAASARTSTSAQPQGAKIARLRRGQWSSQTKIRIRGGPYPSLGRAPARMT